MGRDGRVKYPFGKQLTPKGRFVWYQLDKRFPDGAFVGVSEKGKLIWAGLIHLSEAKAMSPDGYDKLVRRSARGRALARELR